MYQNKDIAIVKMLHVNRFDVFKWLRKNMDVSIKEANRLSKEKEIDFLGDIDLAFQFYKYLQNCLASSAEIIIEQNFNNSRVMPAFVISEEEINENEKYSKEYDNE